MNEVIDLTDNTEQARKQMNAFFEKEQEEMVEEDDLPLEFMEDDFEVNDYRFIKYTAIDKIQQEELGGDEYILGCFNPSFLADVLNIDMDVIEAMQKAEAYEAIGKLVLSLDKLEELQQEYSSDDGYGHHFGHYDGNEHELDLGGEMYLAFKIN